MSFSEADKLAVWRKGDKDKNNDEAHWRKDQCGAWIKYSEHGNRNSQYGWEIDHITPSSKGGSDQLSNLRPLQWQNNMSKSNGRLVCVITSKGENNVSV